MTQIINKKMFVKTDVDCNNNKYWEAILYDNDTVIFNWGRVGQSPQTTTKSGGNRLFESKIREKLNKGYTETNIISKTVSSIPTNSISEVAKKQINYNSPIVEQLIERLAQENKHQILEFSGGNIQINDNGIVTTPLGVIGLDSLDKAKDKLNNIIKFVKNTDFERDEFKKLLNEYLMLVPQKVPSQKGWHKYFIRDHNDIIKQTDFLNRLESSVNIAQSQIDSTIQDQAEIKKIFDLQIKILDNNKEIEYIKNKFFKTLNTGHTASCLKPINFYEVEIKFMKERFDRYVKEKKLDNIWLLWHGTRTYNLLSILKMGLIIPKGGSFHITGRMFGDGLYFSDQSTKSLNYSMGYWDRRNYDYNCFMFMADVAMGKYYTPKTYNCKLPREGYDSTFAKAHESGVQNNEMIVYKLDQVNLKYLIEFKN